MRLLPWLANPGNPAMSPHTEGNKGTCHTGIIYTVESREGRGRTIQLCLKAEGCYHECMRHPCACGQQKTTDCISLLMLAPSKHWCRCMIEHSRMLEHRPLTDALVQVPHKIQLGTREHRHMGMHWGMCITIPHTVKGTQMLCC